MSRATRADRETEKPLPNRAALRRDRLDPRVIASTIDALVPTLISRANDIELPNRAKLLVLTELPPHCAQPTDSCALMGTIPLVVTLNPVPKNVCPVTVSAEPNIDRPSTLTDPLALQLPTSEMLLPSRVAARIESELPSTS